MSGSTVSVGSTVSRITINNIDNSSNHIVKRGLTLSRVAPSAVSKGWGGADWAPPMFLRVLGWFWFQILVATSDLTMIDTRQKDLQLSDA